MKEYLEKVLCREIEIIPVIDIYEVLPLAYKGQFDIFKINMADISWLAVKPKLDIGLIDMRRARLQIEKAAALNTALILENTRFYIKEKLLEEQIPFVIIDKQAYLPFIGIALSEGGNRNLAPVHLISFLTQKMVLMAIYESWQETTVTKAAEKLNVTKMSASRCFDEIEYLDFPMLSKKGRSRVITVEEGQELFELVRPKLRNPIIKRFELKKDVKLSNLAGEAAISKLSLLDEGNIPTYAITKAELGGTDLSAVVVAGESPKCVVYELGYFINFRELNVEDPYSVLLGLNAEEKEDDRLMISINEAIKEHVC